MRYETGKISNMHVVHLANGEDLLAGLEEFVAEAGIEYGSILSAVGSIKSYHSHVVRSTGLPPGNDFTKGEGPFDILTITGVIIGGRVHAHIEYSDRHVSHGGHLEPETIVLTFVIVTIAELDGMDLTGMDRYEVP